MPVPDGYDANQSESESQHIKAAEMPQNWKATLTISDVNLQQFGKDGQGKREKLVISFVGKTKTYVCNATNRAFLSAALGSKPNHWVGAKIQMARSMTRFEGQMVPCFVVVGATPAEAHEQEPGEDAPF